QRRLKAGTPRPMPADDLKRRAAVGCAPAIIDVRNDAEVFFARHIQASLHIQESRTTALVQALQRFNGAVLVCDDGRLSSMVCRTVGFCGFENVFYLEGGLKAWEEVGGPLVETRPTGRESRIVRPEEMRKLAQVYRSVTPRALFYGLAGSCAVLGAAILLLL
ncbi:MAG TPA: rhodanese-like domain-containing protein, partial [Planctomycetota bacterium]|nr:rhodanese-like domain-containing protein [Planctomycetota bacterium]